ncbi:MAG: aldo/keto reductase [Acidobacteriota bacterium]
MKYRKLADTGIFVSELCLGTMTFGGRGQVWERMGALEQADVNGIVHRALEAGINFVDTANVYATGESETLVGRALSGRRQEVVLATKVRGRMGPGPNEVGLSRSHIIDAVDASLTRLGTDYIDLYQIHRPDMLTNIEDTLRALDDLVRSGKVRYIGCSNVPAWLMMKANAVSREQHIERFRCTQSYYSLVGRDLEREIVPFLRDQQMGLLVWSPLAGGFLSGKFTRDGGAESGRRTTFDFPPVDKAQGFDVLDVLRAVADRHGVTVPQVALAWVLAHDVVTSVIIGARTRAQLDDNLRTIDLVLSPEDLKELDEASKIAPGYPAWMDSLGSDRAPGERRF